MVVDLARNDLGRVCVPGTVEVVDFMTVERYSHVMYLVSTVEGRLAPGRTAYDVLRATFPAGTLSGAPNGDLPLPPSRQRRRQGNVAWHDMSICVR
jgi:anthranilate synthase component I